MTFDLWPGFKVAPTDRSRDLSRPEPARTAPAPREAPTPQPFTRETYNAACERRWDGPALRDAKQNWRHWQELHPDLEEAMHRFHRDPMQKDAAGQFHNPTGYLTDFIWNLQRAWQPNQASLAPLLDFEENHQRVFLRRGLLIYCQMLLREIEKTTLTKERELPNTEQP